MQRVASKRVVIAVSAAVVLIIVTSAFVLFALPHHQSTTVPSNQGSSSQAPPSVKLIYTDIISEGTRNDSITARTNEVFIVHLDADTGSTGYDWNVTTSGSVRYLNYTTTNVGTLPGAPSGRDYFFQALTPGAATITLVYGRFPPAFSVTQIGETLQVSVAVTP